MALHGRIAGISGIVGGAVGAAPGDLAWRLAFALGLVTSPLAYRWAGGVLAIDITASTPLLIIGGVLVGVGTQLGSGCTSGHGVCGLARVSARSMAATGTFMAAAMVTVYSMRHAGA
jgi:hypothetical protein